MLLEDGDRRFVVTLTNGQVETVWAHNEHHAQSVALNDRVVHREKGQHKVTSVREVIKGCLQDELILNSGHFKLKMNPGASFDLVLPDGTILNVEQTADDFSIVNSEGIVLHSQPTSDVAKKEDGYVSQT